MPDEALKETLARAFDEGARAGAEYQFKLAHAIEQGNPDPDMIINPFRSQT